MRGSGSFGTEMRWNSTIANITDDEENQDSFGAIRMFILICVCCALFTLIICYCQICCQELCCLRGQNVTRNYYSYNSTTSDYNVENGDENEVNKQPTPISIKNQSFITMVKFSNFQHAEETCSICLEAFGESNEYSKVIKTACGHLFHLECVHNDSIVTCPLCREPFQANEYFDIL